MKIFERQMAEARLYARLRQRRYRLDFALSGIEEMLRLAPRAYVSVSFGKQSVCLAHMIYQIAPQIPMYFLASEESWWIHNFQEVIETFLAQWPIELTIVQTLNITNSESWQESRDKGQWDLQTMTKREYWDGWYWGLSKGESADRERTLSSRWKGQPHPTIFKYVDSKYRCCPIMEWELLDLAAYISEHNLPLLNLYKEQGLQVRTTARVTRMMADYGGLARSKCENLEGFNRFAAEFPEVRCYT
jgi:3'-phosphoadenosine 5'-phosphosulfate sulfotransferase (PAPS reductase)/FAD synthetase